MNPSMNPLQTPRSFRRYGKFRSLEPRRLMAAVAEGPLLRSAAAAQGNILPPGDIEFLTPMVDQCHRPRDHQRTIFSCANSDLRHG